MVTIAIIRYNATERTNYKGPIFVNPGGPGGSGIWFVKHLAPYYQSVVGRNHVSICPILSIPFSLLATILRRDE
jgi:pimeloyl-ACP methyl ester carboxylesterase